MSAVAAPERGLPRSQDQTIPLRADLYHVAQVRCHECGELFPVTVLVPWQRTRNVHLGPRAAQLVHEKDGYVVREGVDVPSPLCRSCFAKAAPAALKEKMKAWKARLDDHRSALERQRREAEEEKARVERDVKERMKTLDDQLKDLEGD